MRHRFWRWLIPLLAMSCAAKLFGMLGFILVGVLLLVLVRWPKAQTITASVLAIVLFIGVVVVASPQPQTVAHAAAHPDLDAGQNAPWKLTYKAASGAQLTPTPAQQTVATYLQSVTRDAMDCQRAGGNVADCYIKASPRRCTQTAIDFMGSLTTNAFEAKRRAWVVCVNSCRNAGVWSQWFGACRR